MKWIIICIVALIICFGIVFLISKLIFKKLLKTIFSTIIFGLLLCIVCTFGYLGIYSRPKEDAKKVLNGNEIVEVNKVDGGYLFDGQGKNKALIFYPGAKVKCEAYAPLMLNLAENGIDCFLVDMPFNFALFSENRCEKFLDSYKYENWILSGHSMGGLVAANYTSKHPDKIKGLVLLAAYPGKKISDSVNLLSIYGSKDGCLEKGSYDKDKENWPKNSQEFIIEGGNHAQFGDYGKQKGDNSAAISKEEQWNLTSNRILEWSSEWSK